MVELATRVALGETLADLGWRRRPARAAGPGRGEGAGLLDAQAARCRPDAGAGHAVDRRGDRPARRIRAWRWPRRWWPHRCAHRSPGERRTGAAVDRRSRQGRPGRAGRPAGGGQLPLRRDLRHGAGAARSWATRSRRWAVSARRRAGRSVLDAIASGDVLLVVNTPSPESRPVSDAGRHPDGGHGRGHPLPDVDGHRARRRGGARPGRRRCSWTTSGHSASGSPRGR